MKRRIFEKARNPGDFLRSGQKKRAGSNGKAKALSKPLPSFSVFDPVELGNISYHEVFFNGEVICHVCLSGREAPAVRVIDTAQILCEAAIALMNLGS